MIFFLGSIITCLANPITLACYSLAGRRTCFILIYICPHMAGTRICHCASSQRCGLEKCFQNDLLQAETKKSYPFERQIQQPTEMAALGSSSATAGGVALPPIPTPLVNGRLQSSPSRLFLSIKHKKVTEGEPCWIRARKTSQSMQAGSEGRKQLTLVHGLHGTNGFIPNYHGNYKGG